MLPEVSGTETCQDRFHRRWGHLRDPHVRALVWLLDAPDLLDTHAPRWEGKIASLVIDWPAVRAWLNDLEDNPAALHAYLATTPTTRLGRYAEKLLTFYFGWRGILMAHGLQVREPGNATIGEFDFLLLQGEGLLHLELATKFYLFEAAPSADAAEHFIGPNLADTLGAKMQKILHRQLALAGHPAARAYLPQPVSCSQALIKGWLFYRGWSLPSLVSSGVADSHCRGFWCSMSEFRQKNFLHSPATGFLHLPRLAWLAPATAALHEVRDHNAMSAFLEAHFAVDSIPMMVALMEGEGLQSTGQNAGQNVASARESARCFVVPDDWRERARDRNQRSVLKWEAA